MQEILETRDRLRADIVSLDGGYVTIGKILGQSPESILKALSPKNTPRLRTLEKMQEAVTKAKRNQKLRLASINE